MGRGWGVERIGGNKDGGEGGGEGRSASPRNFHFEEKDE